MKDSEICNLIASKSKKTLHSRLYDFEWLCEIRSHIDNLKDINTRMDNGDTLLHFFAKLSCDFNNNHHFNKDLFFILGRILSKEGVDLSITNADNHTPIDVVFYNRNNQKERSRLVYNMFLYAGVFSAQSVTATVNGIDKGLSEVMDMTWKDNYYDKYGIGELVLKNILLKESDFVNFALQFYNKSTTIWDSYCRYFTNGINPTLKTLYATIKSERPNELCNILPDILIKVENPELVFAYALKDILTAPAYSAYDTSEARNRLKGYKDWIVSFFVNQSDLFIAKTSRAFLSIFYTLSENSEYTAHCIDMLIFSDIVKLQKLPLILFGLGLMQRQREKIKATPYLGYTYSLLCYDKYYAVPEEDLMDMKKILREEILALCERGVNVDILIPQLKAFPGGQITPTQRHVLHSYSPYFLLGFEGKLYNDIVQITANNHADCLSNREKDDKKAEQYETKTNPNMTFM